MKTLLIGLGLLLTNVAHAASPEGWFMAGSHPNEYSLNLDETQAYTGTTSAVIANTDASPRGFGTMMQSFKPTDYLGKRIRLRAWVKSDSVKQWAGLWMRLDGPGGDVLGFDNMQDRPIQATTDWHAIEIVLDVSPKTQNLSFGVLLSGKGSVWIDDISFEVVGDSVATTGDGGKASAKRPSNLSFED